MKKVLPFLACLFVTPLLYAPFYGDDFLPKKTENERRPYFTEEDFVPEDRAKSDVEIQKKVAFINVFLVTEKREKQKLGGIQNIRVPIEDNFTVLDIKKSIQKSEGIPVALQKLCPFHDTLYSPNSMPGASWPVSVPAEPALDQSLIKQIMSQYATNEFQLISKKSESK